MLVALAGANLVVTALPCAGGESFLAPNPQAPDAVPYRRSLEPRSPHRAEGDTAEPDERRTPGAAAADSPTRPVSADDGGAENSHD